MVHRNMRFSTGFRSGFRKADFDLVILSRAASDGRNIHCFDMSVVRMSDRRRILVGKRERAGASVWDSLEGFIAILLESRVASLEAGRGTRGDIVEELRK